MALDSASMALDEATHAAVLAEVERIAPHKAVFAVPAETTDAERALISLDDLKAMFALQKLFFDHHYTSHRPVIGPLIVALKRWMTAFFNYALRIVLVRQAELNQRQWNVALGVYLLEQRVRDLERRLEGEKS